MRGYDGAIRLDLGWKVSIGVHLEQPNSRSSTSTHCTSPGQGGQEITSSTQRQQRRGRPRLLPMHLHSEHFKYPRLVPLISLELLGTAGISLADIDGSRHAAPGLISRYVSRQFHVAMSKQIGLHDQSKLEEGHCRASDHLRPRLVSKADATFSQWILDQDSELSLVRLPGSPLIDRLLASIISFSGFARSRVMAGLPPNRIGNRIGSRTKCKVLGPVSWGICKQI